MTKPDAYDRVIEKFHLSVHPGSPDDPPPEPEYFLVGKRRGFCPECDGELKPMHQGYDIDMMDCGCPWYDQFESEDTNRIRYAAERLEDAMVRQP